jgi:hypothetical protein
MVQAEHTETRLEMLLEFLQTSRSLKERNLHDKSVRIETLSADIDLVKSRKEELAAIQHVTTRAVHAPPSSSAKVSMRTPPPSLYAPPRVRCGPSTRRVPSGRV